MKKTLAILGIALFASCSPDAPEGKPSSRVGNTDDGKTGIIIEVDTAKTEYEIELKM